MDIESKLENKWILWYHPNKDNWKLNSYKILYEIETIGDFWRLNNNWNVLKNINNKHLFLMKEHVTPLWEDENNINGGCWSFKIHEDLAEKLWIDLSAYLVCEQLIDKNDAIGVSISTKKNNNVVIKIWNRDNKKNSLTMINKEIIKYWGCDVIYIAHMSNT